MIKSFWKITCIISIVLLIILSIIWKITTDNTNSDMDILYSNIDNINAKLAVAINDLNNKSFELNEINNTLISTNNTLKTTNNNLMQAKNTISSNNNIMTLLRSQIKSLEESNLNYKSTINNLYSIFDNWYNYYYLDYIYNIPIDSRYSDNKYSSSVFRIYFTDVEMGIFEERIKELIKYYRVEQSTNNHEEMFRLRNSIKHEIQSYIYKFELTYIIIPGDSKYIRRDTFENIFNKDEQIKFMISGISSLNKIINVYSFPDFYEFYYKF